jgi:hypothetical protein
VGLTQDDNGIPKDAKTRIDIAEKIVNRAEQMGIHAKMSSSIALRWPSERTPARPSLPWKLFARSKPAWV